MMWRDALKTEMYNVGMAFEILGDGEKAPQGWSNIAEHLRVGCENGL